jgi:hypothetical protein
MSIMSGDDEGIVGFLLDERDQELLANTASFYDVSVNELAADILASVEAWSWG